MNRTMSQSGKIDVPPAECCMCGDSGIPDDLYWCKVCHFRSQHRYCSNQYPKAGSYEVCNWCLVTQMEDSENSARKAAAQSSLDSNSSHNNTLESDQDGVHTKRTRKSVSWKPSLHLQAGGKGNGNGKVKKATNGSPEVSPTTTLRKRIITSGTFEEKLRRTKSEEMANSGSVPRHVLRNKLRRYKLLDEVSS